MIAGLGDLPDTSPMKKAKEIPIVTIRRCLGPILNPMVFAVLRCLLVFGEESRK